jgi:hypothetical protein
MLNMRGCTQAGITDAAFACLRGIHTQQMVDCTQAGITDAAFAHLRGIHTLDVSGCGEAITGSGFGQLVGISRLLVSDYDLFNVATDLSLAVRRLDANEVEDDSEDEDEYE